MYYLLIIFSTVVLKLQSGLFLWQCKCTFTHSETDRYRQSMCLRPSLQMSGQQMQQIQCLSTAVEPRPVGPVCTHTHTHSTWCCLGSTCAHTPVLPSGGPQVKERRAFGAAARFVVPNIHLLHESFIRLSALGGRGASHLFVSGISDAGAERQREESGGLQKRKRCLVWRRSWFADRAPLLQHNRWWSSQKARGWTAQIWQTFTCTPTQTKRDGIKRFLFIHSLFMLYLEMSSFEKEKRIKLNVSLNSENAFGFVVIIISVI